MRKKRTRQTVQMGPILVVAVAVVLVVVLVVAIVKLGNRNDSSEASTAAGIAYLEALEARDPDAVNQRLRQYQQEQMLAQQAELQRQIEEGEVDVWSLFEDYVVLGDSRAVGFWTFNYLPQERVLADGGDTIRELQGHIDDVVRIDPARVFLCYGLNDVSIGYWDTKEEYVAEFEQILLELQEKLPDLEIYVSSILPANSVGIATMSKWAQIPDFNVSVEEMCAGMEGVVFVDNTDICEAHPDLWETDGVHFYREFYPYWAENLIMAVYRTAAENAGGVVEDGVTASAEDTQDSGSEEEEGAA